MSSSSRSWLIDALKALASQLIVLHHLCLYGPGHTALGLTAWLRQGLAEYGRLAVPIFLVVAGYLSAQRLAPRGQTGSWALAPTVAQRWWRLTPTYWSALALCLAACALARFWADWEALPAPPSAGQFLANLLMIQDVVGAPALSAGVWYVAIDWQLFALFALLMALGRASGRPHTGPWLVLSLTAASLLGFNLDPAGDAWAPYFFGVYGLGVLAAWHQDGVRRWGGAATIAVLGALALAVEFRTRIAVATLTALLLALAPHAPPRTQSRLTGLITGLSRISYAVFLTHFAAAMVCFAAAQRFAPALALDWILLPTWAASLALGAWVHQSIEAPRPVPPRSSKRRAGLLRLPSALRALSSSPGRKTRHVSAPMAAPPTRSL